MTSASKALSKTESEQEQPIKLLSSPDSQTPSIGETPADRGKIRILVYGSLKQACGNHALMTRIEATWIGYDSITGNFAMMSFGGYPGVVRMVTESPTTVFGELYSIDEEGLAALDLLESHPNWYERLKFRTDIHDRRAWMYTLPPAEGYLDPSRYNSVPATIWQPTQDEITFWAKTGVTISGS